MQQRPDLTKMSQRAPRQWQVRFSNENACPGSIGSNRTKIRLTRRQLTARAASRAKVRQMSALGQKS